MKKVYFLSTCNTCKRIIEEVSIGDEFEYQDIKTEKITEDQLAQMGQMAGGYEPLFSRVARKYKALGLKEKQLGEDDYKNYILEEYTFLKRPVFIVGDKVFVGNSKKNVEALKAALEG